MYRGEQERGESLRERDSTAVAATQHCDSGENEKRERETGLESGERKRKGRERKRRNNNKSATYKFGR